MYSSYGLISEVFRGENFSRFGCNVMRDLFWTRSAVYGWNWCQHCLSLSLTWFMGWDWIFNWFGWWGLYLIPAPPALVDGGAHDAREGGGSLCTISINYKRCLLLNHHLWAILPLYVLYLLVSERLWNFELFLCFGKYIKVFGSMHLLWT